ncbi:hypothetical protein HY570_01135 [Candidatus Micrarchaeota archaeon]|nr:hypothetical protein [Candidatus Micrarchaeota archaeon]
MFLFQVELHKKHEKHLEELIKKQNGTQAQKPITINGQEFQSLANIVPKRIEKVV